MSAGEQYAEFLQLSDGMAATCTPPVANPQCAPTGVAAALITSISTSNPSAKAPA